MAENSTTYIDPSSQVTDSKIETGARVYKHCYVSGCHLSEGSIVGDYSRVERTRLGQRVRLQRYQVIYDSAIGRNTYTGRNFTAWHCEIGSFCSIFLECEHRWRKPRLPAHYNTCDALDALQAVQELAKRAVLSVGIHDGPAHVEIIVTEQGPKVVELGARLGGDCIATHLVPLSTGVDLVKATIQVALGQTPDIEPSLSQGAAIRYIVAPEGQIRSIVGVANAREVEDVQEITLTKRVGDVVEDLRSSVDRVGFVIAQGFNSGEATARCEEAATRIRIDSQEEAIRLDEYGRT